MNEWRAVARVVGDIRRVEPHAETLRVNTTRAWRRPQEMPFVNVLANRAFALMARILLGLKTTRVYSGMRACLKSIDAVAWNPRGPLSLWT